MKPFLMIFMMILLLATTACKTNMQNLNFIGPVVHVQEVPVLTETMLIHEIPQGFNIMGAMPRNRFIRNEHVCNMTPLHDALADKTELWCKVDYRGIVGWVKAADLKTDIVEE